MCFWGATVGTLCCLSMSTMAHPVSHNYVDLAVHCTIGGLGGVSVLSTCLSGQWYSLHFLSQVLRGFHGSLCISMLFFGTVSVPLVWIFTVFMQWVLQMNARGMFVKDLLLVCYYNKD